MIEVIYPDPISNFETRDRALGNNKNLRLLDVNSRKVQHIVVILNPAIALLRQGYFVLQVREVW